MSVVEKTRVFRTSNEVEVRALADRLEDQGLDVYFVGDELVSGPYGLFGADLTPNLELWVDEEDADRARSLIEAWNDEHHPNRPVVEKRPLLRYSLKSLLFLMTVVALAAAIFAASGVDGIAFCLGVFELGLILLCTLRFRWSRTEAVEIDSNASPHDVEESAAREVPDP